MITQYIKGDIVEIFRLGNDIAHGCNCFCVMGAGVAGQLRSEFPQVAEADDLEDDYFTDKRYKLGKFSIADHLNGVNVCYNVYSQYNPGPSIDYGALLNCFINLNKARADIKRSLYIPRIGAGIAGGDWKLIEKLINLVTPNISIIVVDYCPNPVVLDNGETISLDFLENADTIKRDPKRLP